MLLVQPVVYLSVYSAPVRTEERTVLQTNKLDNNLIKIKEQNI